MARDSDGYAEVLNLKQLYDRLGQPRWLHKPVRNLLTRWSLFTRRKAVAGFGRGKGGWIFTNETRKSVTEAVDTRAFPEWAKVGSDKPQARWGEYGTGLLSEDPLSSKKRHWPPAAALQPWADKKQIPKLNAKGEATGKVLTGADVAFIIGRRGGIAPRRMFRNAQDLADRRIPAWLSTMSKEVEQEWSSGAE